MSGMSAQFALVTLAEALKQGPPPAGNLAIPAFKHGSLEVELYAPEGEDSQRPHDRDEVYVVVRGARRLRFNSEPADIWIPMAFTAGELAGRGGGFRNIVIARLKLGATLTEAQSELDALAPRIQAQYPVNLRKREGGGLLMLFANPLRDEIVGSVESPLLMLLAGIGLVLLVACTNVANLLLSRAAGRQHEVGLRIALGATRLRLLQLQLSEALLLAMAGGILGVIAARLALNTVPAVLTERVPGLHDVPMDLRVLAFAAGLSLVTALVFATVPFAATERRPLYDVLHESAARSTAGSRRHRVQSALVISTVTLSFVLLIGAGLFLRSFSAMVADDRGFRPAGVLTLSVALPRVANATEASVRAFHASLLQQLTALAGVRSAALATDVPLESYTVSVFFREGWDVTGPFPSTRRSWVAVTMR